MRSGGKAWIAATLIAAVGFITLSQFLGSAGSPTGAGSSIASRIVWSVGVISAITFLVLSVRALLARRSRNRDARLSS